MSQPPPFPPSQPTRKLFFVVALVAVALGLYFRFARLDGKYFWLDETHSASAAAGYSVYELDTLFDGTPRRLVDLQTYLRIRSTNDTTPGRPLRATIDSLRSLPENAPLYFLTLRLWADVFGDSPTALRAYSAALAVLGGLLLVGLCRELGFDRAASACAVCWWSLSPFLVVYSQEARTYALFAVWTISADLLLLRAMRLQSWPNWLGYILTATAGLYTHMFLGLLLIAQGLFVAMIGLAQSSAEQRRRLYLRFAIAGVCIVVAFLPWFAIVLRNTERGFLTNFLGREVALHYLVQSWVEGLAALFVDFGLHGSTPARAVNVAISLVIVAGVFWSAWYVARNAPARTRLFLLTTGGIPPLILIGCDLAFGGTRSETVRFWLPGLVSIGLTFSYAIAEACESGSRSAAIAGPLLLAAAAGSCLRSAAESTWWHKGGVVSQNNTYMIDHREIQIRLAELAAMPGSLLVVERGRWTIYELMAMSTICDPRVEWLGIADAETFEPPPNRTLYLYHTPRLLERLAERGRPAERLEPTWMFYRVEPTPANRETPHQTPLDVAK